MKKTIEIDLSSDRLIAIAADLVEQHNYIGALKMLNKNAGLNGNDEDSYMLYAEVFDDMCLHEKCINSWYKYIDCTSANDLAEAYEGLAVSYMSLGNEHFSAFYYNQLLMETDDIDAGMREEIMQSFLSREPNPLKFVYPPKVADYSDTISNGIDKMRRGEYDGAVEDFETVHEENDSYLSARNYIAMCRIISDKCEQAEEECVKILEKHPDNVQALTTLAAVKTEQKKSEESIAIARRLIELNVTNPDDIFKIATVCCENKLHEEAFALFNKLDGDLSYDSSVLYFRAVSAFNCGKYEESFKAFDAMLAINPSAVTAKYHYDRAREAAENGTEKQLSYFYRLPQEDRESSLKILAAFAKFKKSEAQEILKVADITDCVLWSFDERESSDNIELQFLAMVCAVKAGFDDIIRDVLLNAFIADSLKVRVLTMLAERNEENNFGVVICHIYKLVSFRALKLGRVKRKNFISAYARLTAHFSIIDELNGEAFARSAEKLYAELENSGRLSSASDTDALAAAIFFKARVKEPRVTRKKLCSFFEVSEQRISEILGDL